MRVPDLKKMTPEAIRQMVDELIAGNESLRRALEAREDQTALFNTITENMLDMVALTDMEGNFTFAGKAHEVLGYEPDFLIGKNVMDFVHPEDLPFVKEKFNNVIASGDSGAIEYRYICKDESCLWFETVGRILKDENKRPQKIVFSTRDITERKQAEEALRESEIQYRCLYESIRDAILVADTDRNIIDCNQTFTEMFGYSLPQIKGKKTHTLYEKYEEYLKMGEEIRKHIGSAKFVYTIKYKKKSGEIFPGETNTFYLVNSKKEIIGFIGMIRDVTEQKQVEKEQKQLQTQLAQAQKMESIGRLAGGVAHDFNNMLTIINGYAEMMAEVLPSSDPMYESVQEIQDAGKRSAVIVRKLLAFARKQTIAPVPMNLNDSVSGMLKMLHRLIGENIDLLWKPCQNAWLVKMDFSQIDQILVNIIVNSRDAIADVGKITIETQSIEFEEQYCSDHTGFAPGQFVMLAVSDNGCGMDKHVLDNLFEPFFTTKEIGQGTGLSMPTVYGIVKQNNGFINVYSEPGQGTTVKIYFPRFLEDVDISDKKPEEEALQRGRGETILVLEDETVVLNLSRIMLEGLGYNVITASRPGEAMDAAKAHNGKINLLLTDIIMPEMNGREFAEQLNDLYPDIKMLFMSGYTENVVAHHTVLDDGLNFIEKPFSIHKLAAKVREVLD